MICSVKRGEYTLLRQYMRLNTGFFSEKAVKNLEQQKDGKKKVIVYLKMLLQSYCYGGATYDGLCDDFFEEMSYYFDEEQSIIKDTYMYLEKCGLATIKGNRLIAIMPQKLRQRSSADYKNWRTSVFEKDNYTCQRCNKKGGQLEAHHIKPWASFPKERFDVENGITLCKKCHKKIHSNGIEQGDANNGNL